MKSSQYNVFVDAAKGKSLVYNPVTGAIVTVDRELREYLEKNQVEKADASFIEPLKTCGIIVDDDTDELKIQRLKHNLTKYATTESSSFLVFTTYACNLRCPYCYEGPVVEEERKSALMHPEMTQQVIKFICEQTLENRSQMVCIGLYGGEPLVNMECCETLLEQVSQFCKDYSIKFYTTITTNGTLLTDSGYKRIGKYLSSIHVTLDGPQKFHDEKRRKKDGSGSYATILENLRLLKDTGEHLSIRINFDAESKEFMGEVLDDLEEIGLKGRPSFHIYFAQIVPQDACLSFPEDPEYREWMKKTVHDYPPLMQMALERGWKNHMAIDIGSEHSLVPRNVTSCDYVRRGIYSIDPLGDIYICPASGGHIQYRAGKLCNGNVEWSPSYYHILTRDPTLIAPCNECEILPMCGGGCSIGSFYKYTDYHKSFCSFIKEQMYEKLKAYLRFRYPEKFEEY